MWNDLTMRQRAELIGLGVKNGITNLEAIKKAIKKAYNKME